MKHFLILLSLSILVAACDADISSSANNNSGASNTATDKPEANPESPRTEPASGGIGGCYLRVIGRDTLAAHLEELADNRITGKLTFDNFEKDGSTGTVSGRNDDGVLKLTYTFQSEGMNSVSEMYFKKTAQGIIHGIGDAEMRGDTAVYANPSTVRYAEQDLLKRISCDALPAKYR